MRKIDNNVHNKQENSGNITHKTTNLQQKSIDQTQEKTSVIT